MYHFNFEDNPEANAKAISMRQQARAAERGHVCRYPADNELFLDIDSLDGLGRLHAAVVQNQYVRSIVDAVHTHPSPSGKAGRFHTIVTLKKRVDKFERITLQALLGSDLAREILSYQEAQAGCERPTVFFEKEPPAVVQELSPDGPAATPPVFSARGLDTGVSY